MKTYKINFINYLGICLEEANRVKYPVTQMHQILYSGSLLKSEIWACPAIGSLDRKAYEFLWFTCYFCCCSSSAPVFWEQSQQMRLQMGWFCQKWDSKADKSRINHLCRLEKLFWNFFLKIVQKNSAAMECVFYWPGCRWFTMVNVHTFNDMGILLWSL